MDQFSDTEMAGTIRFGVPDDYAVRLLPVILSHFQKTHPKIIIDVQCQPSKELLEGCLLYTSDAADERSSVDLGGRRII